MAFSFSTILKLLSRRRSPWKYHGVADELSGLARRQAWGEMSRLITDEILETFAVVAPLPRLGATLRSRYDGLADRLTLYVPFTLAAGEDLWSQTLAGFRDAA